MRDNELTGVVVDKCIHIHKDLGPGLFESVYEEILIYELKRVGISCKQQVPIPVIWKDVKMNIGYRADLILEDKLIVELKSIDKLAPVHYKQILTYLKLMKMRLGLLINFNEVLLKDGIRRVVNGY